jgi:O-antigen/teichoic acid export membrane protein
MFVIPNVLLILFLLLFYHNGLQNYFTFIAFGLAILITIVSEAIAIFELNPHKQTISISTKQLIKISSPLLFSGIFLYLLNYTNVIMLGLMTDENQVGIYNIAYKIGSAGFLVIVSVSTIITPRMAELYGQGKMEELKKLTHNATRLIAILSIPITLILICFGKYILSYWGNSVEAGSTVLTIVSIGVLFSAVSGNVDQILNMTENQKILRNITIFSFFFNLVLSYILIVFYGIKGAAIASLFTNIVINLLCIYYIKKKLGFYTLF